MSGVARFLVRHGVSAANLERRIQGRKVDGPLAEPGRVQVAALARSLRAELAAVEAVISSTARRARETADLFARELGVAQACDARLVEVDPGVLAGLTHDEARRTYPREHDCWTARGDLDAIRGAERGDQLQARVLAFLHRYVEQPRGSELIVAHAGLNRCLLNTLAGRRRTTAIDVGHDCIHALPSVHDNLRFEPQLRARKSRVYKVETVDKTYIVKRTAGALGPRDRLQARVLAELAARMQGTPQLLYSCEVEADAEPHTIKVFDYVEGTHVDGPLRDEQLRELVRRTHELNRCLRDMSRAGTLAGFELPAMMDLVDRGLTGLPAGAARALGEALASSAELHELATAGERAPVNFDLHRSNLVFDGDRVGFIDMETFAACPPAFALSSLLVSALLLESPSWAVVDRAVSLWPEPVGRRELLLMMQVRAFVGAAFFAKRVGRPFELPDDRDILARYLAAAELVAARLNPRGSR